MSLKKHHLGHSVVVIVSTRYYPFHKTSNPLNAGEAFVRSEQELGVR
jgi:hypothetical protein